MRDRLSEIKRCSIVNEVSSEITDYDHFLKKIAQIAIRIVQSTDLLKLKEQIENLDSFEGYDAEYRSSIMLKNWLIHKLYQHVSTIRVQQIQEDNINDRTESMLLQLDNTLAIDNYQYIDGRHKNIIKLKHDITELRQLFVDMAFLVQQTGELINSVEYNMNTADKYLQEAVEELEDAVTISRRRCYIS